MLVVCSYSYPQNTLGRSNIKVSIGLLLKIGDLSEMIERHQMKLTWLSLSWMNVTEEAGRPRISSRL